MDNTETHISTLIDKYIQSFNPNEKKAYEVARDHLGSSFNIEISIGFIKYKNSLSK
tara:strand:- start:183 stop:350 length:168 start_codon:yes stop_codon:yes gene_type:complete